MTLEESLNKLKEAFVGKSAEAEAKASEAVALNAKVAELTSALSLKEESLLGLNAKVAELSEKLASAEALAAKASEEAQRIASAQESAGKKAAVIVANAGINNPVEIIPAEAATPKSDEQVVEEWSSMKQGSKEKQAYFDRNKAAILRVLKLS